MKTYNDFQSQAASEKVTLAVIDGAKRLLAWTITSGNIWQLTLSNTVVKALTDNGNELVRVASLTSMSAGCYFFDDSTQILYVQTTQNQNPNQRFLVLTSLYFFANRPTTLPYDLQNGFEVYFEPLIQSTSSFGVELDLINESFAAIEGDGTITFLNDNDFWTKNFDKISFDNQTVVIYSWNSTLRASEAKVIFTGFVDSKSYTSNAITLKVKDLLYPLRATFHLEDIADLGQRNDPSVDQAKQRIVYGAVKGHRPVNLDKLLNGSYPLTGTVSVFFGETSLVGTNTKFLSEVVKGDQLLILGVKYSVSSVVSDTALELTAAYATVTQGNLAIEIIPATAKTYMNRKWLVAGHACSQPIKYVQVGSTTQRLILDSTVDLFDGDDLYLGELGTGELVRIDKVINSTVVTLSQSTLFVYPVDTPVHRPFVQNLKMNTLELVYATDYTVDALSGTLTLKQTAEENSAPLFESAERVTVTSGTNVLNGIDSKFSSYITPGTIVRPQSTDDFYRVLEVTDDTITLTENYTGPSFTTNEAQPEKTSISGLSSFKHKLLFRANPNAVDLQGTYFVLYDEDGSVAVWFDVGNVGTEEPDHGCDRAIEIAAVKAGDSYATVLFRIKQRLELDGKFAFAISADTLTIESLTIGVRPAAKDNSDSGFTTINLTKSAQRITCVGDVGDSLDQQYFVIYDGQGTVAFWIATDNNIGATEPNHGAKRSVKITAINTDDAAATVAAKVCAAINGDGQLSATAIGATITVNGGMVEANLGTLPTGFEMSVSQLGKSAYDLNGKYFALPYHFATGDRTAAFYFDIDNKGTVAPTTGAYSTNAITAVTSDLDEEGIFEAINDAINAYGNFTSEYSENSILVTDVASSEVTTELNAGTSGFTMNQVQAGASISPTAGKPLQYKSFVFSDNDVLSCDVYGKTVSGEITGKLIETAPQIVRDVIGLSGMSEYVDEQSFQDANDLFSERLALVVPDKYNDKATSTTYRTVINAVNNSVFGMLLQSNDFQLEYVKLRPRVSASMPYFSESDILDYSVSTTNSKVVRTAYVNYANLEYDCTAAADSVTSTVSKDSPTAEFLIDTANTKTFASYCVDESDAQRLANRWSFLLENGSGSITFTTKLQGMRLQVSDVILFEHRKFYDRLGGQGKSKLMLVEKIGKRGDAVEITGIDLSNAFNRVAKINELTTNFENSSDLDRLQGGFYSDDSGSIDNDESSYQTNKIW